MSTREHSKRPNIIVMTTDQQRRVPLLACPAVPFVDHGFACDIDRMLQRGKLAFCVAGEHC